MAPTGSVLSLDHVILWFRIKQFICKEWGRLKLYNSLLAGLQALNQSVSGE